jgi:hypothetical protein
LGSADESPPAGSCPLPFADSKVIPLHVPPSREASAEQQIAGHFRLIESEGRPRFIRNTYVARLRIRAAMPRRSP